MWCHLRDKLLEIQDLCVPSKMTSSKFHQPWVNRDIKRLGCRKKSWFKKYRATGDTKARDMYEDLKKTSRWTCKKVFNPLHSPTVPNINWRHPQMPRLDFSAAGIGKLLSDLDEHKATGSDNLSAKLLKTVGSELSPALELLFQSTYQQGVLPSDWRHARVTPIFKKGDRANAENYRPVSLTSIVCKIAEHSQIHWGPAPRSTQDTRLYPTWISQKQIMQNATTPHY